MKICVAQARPAKGDIQTNIESHRKLINLALASRAETIIFPELSLTGYAPELAKELGTNLDDTRFDQFQKISDNRKITIGVGLPIKSIKGTCIGMILFAPKQPRQQYSKEYLHPDEKEFFVGGENFMGLTPNRANVAYAICYELSVPQHAENAFKIGAEIYIASVAKFVDGIDKALVRLSEIAKKYSMTVLMANCVGETGGYKYAGKTSVWNNKGLLAGQLNDTSEGIIVIDTETQKLIEKSI